MPLRSEVDPRAVEKLNLPAFEHTRGLGTAELEGAPVLKLEENVARKEHEGKQEMASFVKTEMLPVILVKLVKRILKGENEDMAELLKDNMEAEMMRFLAEGEYGQGNIGQRMSRRGPRHDELAAMLQHVCCRYLQQVPRESTGVVGLSGHDD